MPLSLTDLPQNIFLIDFQKSPKCKFCIWGASVWDKVNFDHFKGTKQDPDPGCLLAKMAHFCFYFYGGNILLGNSKICGEGRIGRPRKNGVFGDF